MSLGDSAAAFERKCKDLRGGEDLFNGLIGLGIRDFSTLAFTLGTPQKPPTDEQFDLLGTKVFGAPTLGQLALLRKLHFEATTLMVASISEQVKSDTPNYRSRGEIPKILKFAWGKAFVEVVAMWRLACV